MNELDELIIKFLRERLGEDSELAIKLYMAYKEGGRRGIIKVINEELSKVGVKVSEDEDQSQ
ncbi:hypothetical protein [Vulcanisaeta souniana]|uniref:Uncharacterized protein n=1 Tax=Vulcanisaeta souniana JCM 11219 TaxID=1293586 RepID=A0A830E0H8_9CREN|nr:hypothetical protein [Vulcanisaeta souniana]BDR91768.1 hypothetical protein Vsou_08610 [Vulcanisaeta souniana JCM 11219]GGI70538.1 hypothetical protein GCM10007112_04360 [Vulcanisaeta souniana JCM 11219]